MLQLTVKDRRFTVPILPIINLEVGCTGSIPITTTVISEQTPLRLTYHPYKPTTNPTIEFNLIRSFSTEVVSDLEISKSAVQDWSNAIDLFFVRSESSRVSTKEVPLEKVIPGDILSFNVIQKQEARIPTELCEVDINFRRDLNVIKAYTKDTTATTLFSRDIPHTLHTRVTQGMDPSWQNDMQKESTDGVIESNKLDLIAQVTHSTYIEFGGTKDESIDRILDDSNNILPKGLSEVSAEEGVSKRTVYTTSEMSSVVTLQKSVIRSITDK